MKTWWAHGQGAIAAYLCYGTQLPVFKTHSRKVEKATSQQLDFLDDIRAESNEDAVEVVGAIDYTMRLPYTEVMLQRRQERGADVPAWWVESREQFVDDVISEAAAILQERERVRISSH